MTVDEAVRILQRNERGRQGHVRAILMKVSFRHVGASATKEASATEIEALRLPFASAMLGYRSLRIMFALLIGAYMASFMRGSAVSYSFKDDRFILRIGLYVFVKYPTTTTL